MAVPTANLFLKTIPVVISGGDVTAGFKTITYTNTRLEAAHEDKVKVYYNGTLIPRNTTSPTSKYYYELTTILDSAWPGDGPGLPSAADTSSATFSLKRNNAYTGPGYISGTSDNTLSTYDAFVISYYYTVYMV
jgi:hypothetical protein